MLKRLTSQGQRLLQHYRAFMSLPVMLLAGAFGAPTLHAADAPSGAFTKKPGSANIVQALQTCPAYGYGFFQIPASQTCVKIGLDLLFETKVDLVGSDLNVQTQRIVGDGSPTPSVPVLLFQKLDLKNSANHLVPRTNGQINLTTITPSDYGPVVTFISLQPNVDVAVFDQRFKITNSNSISLDQAWVQFAGFTAGRHRSFFDVPQLGYGYAGGYSSGVNLNVLAFTKTFGDSTAVTLSLEDAAARAQVDGVISGGGGVRAPDVVGKIRYEPEWGALQISAAVHQNTDGTASTCCNAASHPEEGYAVSGSFEWRTKWSDIFGPAAGETYGRILVSGAHARGALSYLGAPFFASDYVAGANGRLRLSAGSSGLVSYEHLWTPNFKTTSTVSIYALHSASDTSLIGGLPFNFDYRVRGWQAQMGAEYMPISNLSFGSEVSYSRDHASGSYAGVAATPVKVGVWGMYFYIRRRI